LYFEKGYVALARLSTRPQPRGRGQRASPAWPPRRRYANVAFLCGPDLM